MKIIAVDIGGTHIRHALIDSAGFQVLKRSSNMLTPREDAQALCDAVVLGAEAFSSDLAGGDCLLAVSSAGLVQPSDGSVIALSRAALPAFAQRFDLKAKLEVATGYRTQILNDAQAATYGEYLQARARDSDLQNFMFVTVSTGTGGGFVLNGKLHQGKQGKAGHIGLALYDGSSRFEDVSCGRFVDGKPENLEVSARVIAHLIANKVIELDLEAVSLGGGVALGAKGYIEMVQKLLSEMPEEYRVPVYRAVLGDDAGLVGAAAYAHNTLT